MIVLAELQPYDPATEARVTLRACSANDPAVTGLNNQRWIPAITDSVIQVGTSRFRGDFDGKTSPSAGALNLLLGKLIIANANARRFNWSAAPVKLYAGNSGDAWPWTQIGELSVESFSAEAGRLSLSLKHNEDAFAADVLTATYAGTGGIEGGADLKNRPKPFLLGRCSNVEPVLIDAVNNIYQFSGYGAIQAVNKLYERGSEYPAALADYADYTALAAATVTSGNWATCLASGLVRLGAPAYGVITGDVDGDKAGGTWRRKPGEIMLRLLDNAGVSSGLIETASFTGLDTTLASICTTNLGRMGIYITEQQSVSDVVAMIAAPCNAQAGVSLLGKIFVDRVTVGTPAMTLDAQARQKPRVVRSVEKSVSPPWSFMEFGYDRSWRVHTEDEISLIDPATAGLNSATVFIYKRAASTPTAPLYDTTYTFATGALTGLTGGWTTTIPSADGNPLYTCMAVASSSDATFDIEHMDWSTPSILVNDGDDGTDAKTLTINAVRTFFTFDGTGTLNPGSQSSLVSVNPQNFVGGNVVWTYADNLGTSTSTLAALVTNTSTTSRTVPSTVFTGTPTRTYLSITATGQGPESAISATTTVYRQDNGADGVDATPNPSLSIGADPQFFTFDGASNLTPGTQSVVVTAVPQNLTGGAIVWSYADNLGTASATLAALITATSANVRTVPSSVFTGTPTRLWLRATATGSGVDSWLTVSTTIHRKNDGSSVLTATLSNEAVSVITDGDGNNGDFSGATGQMTVLYGGVDVTASATISEVSETNCTGEVNTATNTPVSGQPKGYYRVTAITGDTAEYKVRAVYNPGSGNITIDKVFSLTRIKKQPRMWVTQDRDEITTDWDGTANPSTQTTTFTATKVDSAAAVTWTVFDLAGNAKTPTSSYLSSATGDTVTMTAAQFASAIGSTEGVIINAELGSNLVKVGLGLMRKKSARPGKYWQVVPNKVTVHTDSAGSPTDPVSNILTATSANTTGVTYVWTLFDGAGTAKTPLSSYGTLSGTGDSVLTITNANMLTAAGATGSIKVVCTPSDTDLAPITWTITEVGDGASAVSTEIYGTRDRVTRDAWGRIWPSSQTTNLSLTRKNFTGGTVAWTITDGDGNALTPSTYLSSTSGDTTSITAANVSAGAGSTRRVIIYATVNSLVTAYPIVLDTVGPIGGNEFPDPQFNAGTTAWVSQPVAPFSFQTNGVTNGYKYENYIRSTSTTTTETYLTISEKIPVRYSGEKFWFGFSGGNVGSGTMPQGAFIRFRNLAGSLVGSTTTLTTTAAITLSSDWPQIISSAVTAPSGAAYVEIGAYRAGIGAITSTLGYSTQFFLQRNEPGADITSTAFPAIAPQLYPASPTVTLPAGWKGDAPTSFKTKFTRIHGTTDVSSSATWTVVQNYGCTVSIASDGTATVTGSSNWEYGNAFFRVKSTYLGTDEFQTVKIMLDMAAPPVPFTDSKLLIGSPAPSTVTATSYASPSVIWGPHTINSMTAGVIAGTLVFQFEADAFGAGSASINIKGQYRAVGGPSWTDMGLNTSKSLGQLNADGTSKATIGASWGVASGLTNNTDYEFRVIAYKTTAGSVAATPKVVYLNSGVQL